VLQDINLLTAAAALIMLTISILSVYRPNLVWGDPKHLRLPEAKLQRLYNRRKIGTVVFFIAGAVLLILSTK
jgi:hypothetical protein